MLFGTRRKSEGTDYINVIKWYNPYFRFVCTYDTDVPHVCVSGTSKGNITVTENPNAGTAMKR